MQYYRAKPEGKRLTSIFIYPEDLIDGKLRRFTILHRGHSNVKFKKIPVKTFRDDEIWDDSFNELNLSEFRNRVLKQERRKEKKKQ